MTFWISWIIPASNYSYLCVFLQRDNGVRSGL